MLVRYESSFALNRCHDSYNNNNSIHRTLRYTYNTYNILVLWGIDLLASATRYFSFGSALKHRPLYNKWRIFVMRVFLSLSLSLSSSLAWCVCCSLNCQLLFGSHGAKGFEIENPFVYCTVSHEHNCVSCAGWAMHALSSDWNDGKFIII